MGIFHKLLVVFALFLTSSGASVFGQSEQSAKGETSQTKIEQTIEESSESHKNEEAQTSQEKTTSSESPVLHSESAPTIEEATQETEPTSSSTETNEITSQPEETTPQVEVATEAEEVTAAAETETISEEPAVSTTTTQAVNEPVATPQAATQQAMQLKINGQLISYTNAGQGNGQAIIDANPNEVATWGGVPTQSGNDNANTHFIGHNPGIFDVLFSLQPDATISVADTTGAISNYHVTQIVTVDDSGYAADGTDYWDQITGTGGGERITLQTCINDDYNLIVFANA
ncbi:sortase domain-containing protein [Enterococcus sp. DIV0800]|uniref:class F sortase n=1 Tax=unclassified Enterococcus TaxID=2608891 RepID=UPI003D2FF415